MSFLQRLSTGPKLNQEPEETKNTDDGAKVKGENDTKARLKPTKKDSYKKGEFAPEKDAWKDDAKLEAAAASWRERQGLADETSSP